VADREPGEIAGSTDLGQFPCSDLSFWVARLGLALDVLRFMVALSAGFFMRGILP
jgi:hypothetical protein